MGILKAISDKMNEVLFSPKYTTPKRPQDTLFESIMGLYREIHKRGVKNVDLSEAGFTISPISDDKDDTVLLMHEDLNILESIKHNGSKAYTISERGTNPSKKYMIFHLNDNIIRVAYRLGSDNTIVNNVPDDHADEVSNYFMNIIGSLFKIIDDKYPIGEYRYKNSLSDITLDDIHKRIQQLEERLLAYGKEMNWNSRWSYGLKRFNIYSNIRYTRYDTSFNISVHGDDSDAIEFTSDNMKVILSDNNSYTVKYPERQIEIDIHIDNNVGVCFDNVYHPEAVELYDIEPRVRYDPVIFDKVDIAKIFHFIMKELDVVEEELNEFYKKEVLAKRAELAEQRRQANMAAIRANNILNRLNTKSNKRR